MTPTALNDNLGELTRELLGMLMKDEIRPVDDYQEVAEKALENLRWAKEIPTLPRVFELAIIAEFLEKTPALYQQAIDYRNMLRDCRSSTREARDACRWIDDRYDEGFPKGSLDWFDANLSYDTQASLERRFGPRKPNTFRDKKKK